MVGHQQVGAGPCFALDDQAHANGAQEAARPPTDALLTLCDIERTEAQRDDGHAVQHVQRHAGQTPQTHQSTHGSVQVAAGRSAAPAPISCDTPPANTVTRTRPGSAVPVAAKSNGVCLPWLSNDWRETCQM